MTFRLVTYHLFSTSWLVILFGVTIYKFIWTDQIDILRHYTSWNWIFNTIFFILERVASFLDWYNGSISYMSIVYSYVLWVIQGSNWIVFWLVWVILYQNPNILLEQTIDEGGKYTLGQVIIGDRLLHVLPVIIFLIYFILRLPEIIKIISWWKRNQKLYFLLFSNSLTTLLLVGSYRLLFDARDVYGITLSPGFSFLIIISTILVFVDLNILIFANYNIKLK